MTVPEFVQSCIGEALPPETPIPDWDIEDLRISGDTAVVIVTNVWAGFRFRDTLTLLQHEGRWSLVFKCFHHLG